MELDEQILQIRTDPTLLDNFILSYEKYILSIASKVSKKYISTSDDEWSVSLAAFHEAINKYDLDRGHFLPFAELLITRSLIDYFRHENRKPITYQLEDISDTASPETTSSSLVDEIQGITQVLSSYNFTFMELTQYSPKAEKTKESCRLSVIFMLEHPILLSAMRQSKLLPIKILATSTKVSRKILERHRKYIIAVIEILDGDFPQLSEYLKIYKK